MKRVAVVVPVYKNALTPFEQISLNHLKRYCSEYDWFLVHPVGKTFDYDTSQFQHKPMTPKYFESIEGYNQLCLSPEFYEQFNDYEYILIYQLDAYVFKDELDYWCNQGYSYIGAPWLKQTRATKLKQTFYKLFGGRYPNDKFKFCFAGVGNGGLSLRHIKDTLNVLYSNKLNWVQLLKLYNPFILTPRDGLKWRLPFWWLVITALQHIFNKNETTLYKKIYDRIIKSGNKIIPEDTFFYLYGSILNKEFKIAPAEIANLFAIERGRVDLKIEFNKNKLPFGAHACFLTEDIAEQYRKYFKFIE